MHCDTAAVILITKMAAGDYSEGSAYGINMPE